MRNKKKKQQQKKQKKKTKKKQKKLHNIPGRSSVMVVFLFLLVEAVLTSTHNLCFDQIYVKYRNFLSENFHFLVVKYFQCI